MTTTNVNAADIVLRPIERRMLVALLNKLGVTSGDVVTLNLDEKGTLFISVTSMATGIVVNAILM